MSAVPDTGPSPSDAMPRSIPVLPAATVMLVRDAPGARGVEVCLLRRNKQSAFVGGALVFPGGAVDAADTDPAVLARCVGLSAAEADAAMGVPSGGLAYWVAALREAFEECGVLVASDAAGTALRLDQDPASAERFARHRQAVDRGERTLGSVLEQEELQLDLRTMHLVAHWVTPAGAPRRYDTRFFVAPGPVGQPLAHDDREVISAEWDSPAVVLAKFAAGEVAMLPPTVASLRWLDAFASAAEVLAAAAALDDVPRILPKLLTELDGSTRIVLPSDERYTDAFDAGSAEDPPAWPPPMSPGRPS